LSKWLERRCQLCKLLFSSFCCRPTFASFERGDTQGETRGERCYHQLCKLLFSSFCCRFGASRVLHCCGEKSVQVKDQVLPCSWRESVQLSQNKTINSPSKRDCMLFSFNDPINTKTLKFAKNIINYQN
jgi:hypothetical protein